jgi:peptidoglycan/LPS O-acetylase OafA/YrhL
MKYSAPLDGLRAVAILAVLVFHVHPAALPGGFTGVDVFFVLSGYLIASVILHDIRKGHFSMQEFYLRRIQRLLPNAVAMVLVTIALSYFALLPLSTVKVAEHGVWSLFNVSNFYIWRYVGGYWGDSAASLPLLHTWSLAIEEQFYVVFPVALWLLSRRPRLCSTMSLLALASFAVGVYGTWTRPVATFYLLPTRAWELLAGASLAAYCVPADPTRTLRVLKSTAFTELLGWSGLGLIVAGFVWIGESDNFPGVVALVPTIGTLAVLASIAAGGAGPAEMLGRGPMVLVGKLSYSIYLWHWPLIVLGRNYATLTGYSQSTGAIVGASIGVALSVIAYQFIEQPLRKRGPGRTRRLWVIATGFATVAATCLIVSRYHPVADPAGYFNRPVFSRLRYNVHENSAADEALNATKFADVIVPPAEPHPPDVWNLGGIIHHWGPGNPRIVVLGSSHALMYGSLIDSICEQLKIPVAFFSADGVSVFFSGSDDTRPAAVKFTDEFNAARKKWISEWRPDAILVIDRWDNYDAAPADFDRQVRDLVAELSPFTKHVILFSQAPVLRVGETNNLREFVVWKMKSAGSPPTMEPDTKEPFRRSTLATFENLTHEFPKLELLRADQLFYNADGSVRYLSGRSFLYADDDHLTDAGAELVRNLCTQAIATACGIDLDKSNAGHQATRRDAD